MKSERRIERILRRIDVRPDAERKRLRLEELLGARARTKKPTSADAQSISRRYIMNRGIWKIAASLVVVATVIGVIGILHNGGQKAYAFEQTVAAMQGKRSFHIQTYYGSPAGRHDEFWAEFDERGEVVRVRQSDQWKRENCPVEVLWADQVEREYRPDYWGGTLVIRKRSRHVDEERLEEFDPEIMVEEIYRRVDSGTASVKVGDAAAEDGNLVIEVTGEDSPYRQVLTVEPQTALVLRMEQYEREDGEGDWRYKKGIDVLRYNEPLDPSVFDPDVFQAGLPDDTIIIDQTSGPIGMVQGELSDEEAAVEVAQQAMEALAADDYETAGMLFGGAPKAYFERRLFLKPAGDIVVGEARPYEWYGPTFKVPCSCTVEQEGVPGTIKLSFWVWGTTSEGQPARWYINPAYNSLSEE